MAIVWTTLLKRKKVIETGIILHGFTLMIKNLTPKILRGFHNIGAGGLFQ